MNYYFQINYYIKLRPNHSGKRSFRLVIEQPWINARYPRRTHIHTRTASHRATDVKRRVKWRITYKGTNLIARLPRAKLQRSYTIRGRPRVQYFRRQRESLSLSLSLGSREFAAPFLSLSLSRAVNQTISNSIAPARKLTERPAPTRGETIMALLPYKRFIKTKLL